MVRIEIIVVSKLSLLFFSLLALEIFVQHDPSPPPFSMIIAKLSTVYSEEISDDRVSVRIDIDTCVHSKCKV